MPRALAEAAARLADFGFYGLVWLTHGLIVEKTYGGLVDFVEHDKPVTDSIMALFGLEDDIRALRDSPGRMLELPAVAVASSDATGRRLNFTIFWLPDDDRPMLLAYQASSQTEMELELSRQIRARLMAEADLAAKSRELMRANADLESFAAIVSHDLKAPLRHMRMIADDLIVQTSERGDAVSASKLLHLQDLSRRMSHMLTELFDYASLGRKYEALAATDTAAFVQAIIDSLPADGFEVKAEGHWPVIQTLAAPFDLILRNLIQNAIQHHDRVHGKIALKCAQEPGYLVISVADDGPGIDPRHHSAVFLPFRTLEKASKAGGTGMGLAMVKKTVETAGGSIEIVSEPAVSRGTRFIVRWPNLITN
jgi:signal transduction histidine kinase